MPETPELFEMACPACGERSEIAEEHRGMKVRCPMCRATFKAGDAPEPWYKDQVEPPPPRPRPPAHPDDEFLVPWDRPANREEAARKVYAPALCLLILGSIGVVLSMIGGIAAIGFGVIAKQRGGNGPFENLEFLILGALIIFVNVPVASVIVYGSRHMAKLKSFGWSMGAAITSILSVLGLVACGGICGIPIGMLFLPVGIWSLVVILQPDVKNAFHC